MTSWVENGHLPDVNVWIAIVYLAAFATTGGLSLVTFDKGMNTWPDLDLKLLEPA